MILWLQVDMPLLQQVKTLIRYTEATSAAGVCGVPEHRAHFLDMPFYETGAFIKTGAGTARTSILALFL